MPWLESGGGTVGETYTHPDTHPDTMIDITDTNSYFTGTKLNQVLDELFQSGSSGKNNVKTAITSKGGTVSQAGTYPTFAELVTAIGGIPAGAPIASGSTTSIGLTTQTVTVRSLSFQPKLVLANNPSSSTHISIHVNSSLWNRSGNFSRAITSNTNEAITPTIYSDGFQIQVNGFAEGVTFTWFALG